MSRKSILAFFDHFYPSVKSGGPARSALGFAELLSNQFEITVVTSNHDFGDEEPDPRIVSNQPVIELGASLGFVSSLIGSRLNKGVLGLSLEANPNLIPVINATLSLNHLANMRVRNLAINYDGQPGVLFNVATDNLVSRLSEESNGTAVEATTLSNLLDELKWQRYTLVSDIEGAEAGFLLADAGALQMCQTVIIELHATHFRGKDYTIDDLGAILVKQHNFQWVDRDGAVAVFKKASSCAE